jgi:hypothetical protein
LFAHVASHPFGSFRGHFPGAIRQKGQEQGSSGGETGAFSQ